MSLKAKALGLGCLAVLTIGIAVVNASATAGGHFGSNRAVTTIEGLEQNHELEFFALGMEKAVVCDETTYHGVVTGMKATGATLTPTLKKCKTVGEEPDTVTIETHDCTLEGTVKAPKPEEEHSTMHLLCPTGKSITLTHPNCSLIIPPQTLNGITYTKDQFLGTESLTIDFTVKNIQYTVHGLCQFFGTNQNNGELKGGLLIKAWENEKAGTVGADIKVTAP